MEQSNYILDYEAYAKAHPDEVDPAWESWYKSLMEDADHGVYTFVMQYIFM